MITSSFNSAITDQHGAESCLTSTAYMYTTIVKCVVVLWRGIGAVVGAYQFFDTEMGAYDTNPYRLMPVPFLEFVRERHR